MSIMRCPIHDRNYDTDYYIGCPWCQQDELTPEEYPHGEDEVQPG